MTLFACNFTLKTMHDKKCKDTLMYDELISCRTHLAHLVFWTLSVVTSFEQTDGTQHLPLYMTKLKSPAARRCFPSAPFPSQPAEADHKKEDAAADACDEADVHALVGRGRC